MNEMLEIGKMLIKTSKINKDFKYEINKMSGGDVCAHYMDESECCGALSVGINDKISLQFTRDKLNHIKVAGAQALITICPFCYMMYDANQMRIEKTFCEKYDIPVLHYPQLLGLALGFLPEELAFNGLRVNSSKILEQVQRGIM